MLLFHFCAFLSRFSELVWKLAGEKSLKLALKRFPFPANSNGSNAKKSRFRPNRNLRKQFIIDLHVTLRSFSILSNSAKRDANRCFYVLLLSSHLLNFATYQKSKFGTCAVTGYRFFKPPLNCWSYIQVSLHHISVETKGSCTWVIIESTIQTFARG